MNPTVKIPHKEIKIGAYYYPMYPARPGGRHESWRIGKGAIDELSLLRNAQPMFQDHKIRRPIAYSGVPAYSDQSRKKVIEGQIELAKEYGIDFFIFDWYMNNKGEQILGKPLNAFINAIKTNPWILRSIGILSFQKGSCLMFLAFLIMKP